MLAESSKTSCNVFNETVAKSANVTKAIKKIGNNSEVS